MTVTVIVDVVTGTVERIGMTAIGITILLGGAAAARRDTANAVLSETEIGKRKGIVTVTETGVTRTATVIMTENAKRIDIGTGTTTEIVSIVVASWTI